MELRHLRYFVAVAEEENISRAASKLHVSQPGIRGRLKRGVLVAVWRLKVLVYATDLSDREWKKVARLLPSAKRGGRPRKHARRLICDAIFYLVRAGCAWRLLPSNFPPWKRVYHYFRAWRLAGVWLRLHGQLRALCRRRAGRSARPSAAIVDSQSAKTTERGGVHGYDGGKKINGRKRHLFVDSSGLVLCVQVHSADVTEPCPCSQRQRRASPNSSTDGRTLATAADWWLGSENTWAGAWR